GGNERLHFGPGRVRRERGRRREARASISSRMNLLRGARSRNVSSFEAQSDGSAGKRRDVSCFAATPEVFLVRLVRGESRVGYPGGGRNVHRLPDTDAHQSCRGSLHHGRVRRLVPERGSKEGGA